MVSHPSNSIGLVMARETGARRAVEARAAEAEAEGAAERRADRLQARLERNRQLVELGVAMSRHHDDWRHTTGGRPRLQSAAKCGTCGVHQRLRHGAVRRLVPCTAGCQSSCAGCSSWLGSLRRWLPLSVGSWLDPCKRTLTQSHKRSNRKSAPIFVATCSHRLLRRHRIHLGHRRPVGFGLRAHLIQASSLPNSHKRFWKSLLGSQTRAAGSMGF